MGIDIAIDLTGLTKGGRAGIFSYRAAPVQVNYLGFSGTIGAEYYDYIIADKVVIPEERKNKYNEKIIYLPGCYLPRDRTQKISTHILSKDKYNLPSVGFIFCCFNTAYKITPSIFNTCMRILTDVDNSVIWISAENNQSILNLKMEAEKRGISSNRLIFAERTELIDEHLARHRLADLFLDTLPYNAHTTASDALWAGLPVLTCMGESFASRVAASLLTSLELQELVTTTHIEYEAKAIHLATNPEKLKAIKYKLDRNRLSATTFNTPRLTKQIESAYKNIYERYQDDLLPDHIYIED
jgi:predicted O-linked N-acetylglucosamine transferase (SPINDLY family)